MNTADDEPKKKRKKPDLPIVSIKSTADYQRMKLDRLMANPEKPVMIPAKPKERNLAAPPDFVRNIMGSSAGAGSGEFHVYRHLRRKEYARQKNIQEQARKEELELEFRQKVEERQKTAEEKASKRKAKRVKKKAAKQRNRGKAPTKKESSSSSSESDTEDVGGKDSIDALISSVTVDPVHPVTSTPSVVEPSSSEPSSSNVTEPGPPLSPSPSNTTESVPPI